MQGWEEAIFMRKHCPVVAGAVPPTINTYSCLTLLPRAYNNSTPATLVFTSMDTTGGDLLHKFDI